jgi:DNA-binding transcriptional regulator YhcF (GntR family)/DNA-binding LacI/PurR family transcriptional regulator
MINDSTIHPRPSIHPSTQRVVDYLRHGITTGVWKKGSPIPSLRQIATDVHVSMTFASRGVLLLRHEGKLILRKGVGTFVGAEPAPVYSQSPVLPRKWQQIRAAIEQQIARGMYEHGKPLPMLSVLRRRYGVSTYTIRRIINDLVSDSIIIPYKKRFLVAPSPSHSSYASVALISLDDGNGNLWAINDRFVQYMVALQVESSKSDVRLSPCPFPASGDPRKFIETLRKAQGHIGYIIWANGIQAAPLKTLVGVIGSKGKPVAIIDEMGDLQNGCPMDRFPAVRTFVIAGHEAGRMTGQYLVGRGHRCVAYINPIPREAWACVRYEGLCTAFEKAGFGSIPVSKKPSDLSRTGVVLFSDHVTEKPVRLAPAVIRLSDSLTKIFNEGLRRQILSFQLMRMNVLPKEELGIDRLQKQVAPLFDAALRQSAISAWVLPSDNFTFFASEYLKGKKVPVPRRLSIIGFDNENLALRYNLSSYSFAFYSVAQRAFSFILNPFQAPYRKAGPIECEGSVIERGSSGRAFSGG